jgi:hypothetical protein
MLLKTEFSSSFTAIIATFNTPSNTAFSESSKSSSTCRCLDNSTRALLGTGAKCSWTSATVFMAYLGNNWTASAGSSIVFDPDVTLPYDSVLTYHEASLVIGKLSLPTTYAKLQPLIQGPDQLGSCSIVVFDGSISTGALNRDMQYAWLMEIEGEEPISYTKALFPMNSTGMTSGVWKLSLRVTNWLQQTNITYKSVSILAGPSPIIVLAGASSMSTSSTAQVTVATNIVVPSCFALDVSSLPVLWTPQAGSPTITKLSPKMLALRTLIIPPKSLTPGLTYSFCIALWGTMNTTLSSISSTCVSIYTQKSPLMAAIAGGNRQISITRSSVLTNATFDASESYDPDVAVRTQSALNYFWTCSITVPGVIPKVISCFSAELSLLYLRNASRISIPIAYFNSSDIFEMTVTAWKDTRFATSTITVEPLQRLIVTTTLTFADPNAQNGVNANDRLVIIGSNDEPAASVLWTAFVGTSPFDDTAFNALSLTNISSSRSNTLIIMSGFLQPGVSYTFKYFAGIQGSPVNGTSTAIVKVFLGPTGGTCFSDKSVGTAYDTDFMFRCDAWTDDAPFLPLFYRFSILSPSSLMQDGVPLIDETNLTPFQPSSSFSVALAPTPGTANFTLIASDVINSNGAITRRTFRVRVLKKIFTSAAAADSSLIQFQKDAEAAAASGDVMKMGASMLAVIDLAGSGTSPAAASASRNSVISTLDDRTKQAMNGTIYIGPAGWQQNVQITSSLASTSSGITPTILSSALPVVELSLRGSNSDGATRDEIDRLSQSSFSVLSNLAAAAQSAPQGSGDAASAATNFINNAGATLNLISQSRLAKASVGETLSMSMTVPVSNGAQGEMAITSSKVSIGNMQLSAEGSSGKVELPKNLLGVLSGGDNTTEVTTTSIQSFNFYSKNPARSAGLISFSFTSANAAVPSSSSSSSSSRRLLAQTTSNAVVVQNLSTPVRLALTMPSPILPTDMPPVCQYWDSSAKSFQTNGCRLNKALSNGTLAICECTVLTDSNGDALSLTVDLGVGISVVAFTLEDFSALSWANLMKYPLGIIVIATFFVAYVIGLVVCYFIDQKPVAPADVEIFRSRVITETKEPYSFRRGVLNGIRFEHPWLSVFLPEPGSSYGSRVRLTLLTTSFMISTALNVVFNTGGLTTFGFWILVVLSSLAMVIFESIVRIIFDRSTK